MHTVFNTVFATILSMFGGLTSASDAQTELPAIVALAASPAQQATLEEALEAFEGAGLALPPLVIEFAPEGDTTLCDGNAGLFTHGSEGRADIVAICSKIPIILLHELAHAHVHESVDAEGIDAFLDHLGLTEWSDQTAKWSDRANERAANVIAYTLTLTAPTRVDKINSLVCDYELLTSSTHANVANANCDRTA